MLAAQIAVLMLSVTGATGSPGAGETVLLDFRADWCGPCRAMEPVVHQLSAAGYPVRMVNIDQDKALAAQFHVHSIPCFVLLINGREVDRTVGQTDPARLQAMFAQAGFDPRAAAADSLKGGAIALAGSSDSGAFPAVLSHDTPFAAVQKASSAAAPAQIASSEVSTNETAPATEPINAEPTNAKLLAACVRLKISDPTGNSYGSGTIVDVRNGEALVLTCAHVFRDSDGKGEILVDVFGPGAPRQVKGRFIGCDLERDVGLVSISAAGPLTAIPVAPPGYKPKPGDRVMSIGCSHGAEPTVQTSHVDSLDRFRGPPNLQVAGQPVQGRSGGGLVSADGLVIGVCNAADPEDNEGLYASLASIHKELDRAGLAFVYKATAAPANVVVADSADMRSLPAKMPDNLLAAENPAVSPAAAPAASPASASSRSAQLTPEEAATLAELRRKANGAEVICIVRPLADPHARSEIIVLDKASSAFLEQLAAERRVQETRQLTSMAVPNVGATAGSSSSVP